MTNLITSKTERIARLIFGGIFYMLLALTIFIISPFIFVVMIIDTKNSINHVLTNLKLLHGMKGTLN